jgi:uncharacterized protein YqjF (DUF2071 family)
VFLTADWRHLAMLNFAIDPGVLRPLVPRGVELDCYRGTAHVSLVGFLFRNTRVWGLSIPGHRHFEEVNLRYYVRRQVDGDWRRGVAFVKELVPRHAVTIVARRLYGENYATVPMGHQIELPDAARHAPGRFEYHWRFAGRENRLQVITEPTAAIAADDSEAAFITENYWGYSGGPDRATIEYRVDHPRWNIYPAVSSACECDVAGLYGPAFVEALSAPPTSAFVADGSAVAVHKGRRLNPIRAEG